MATRLPIGPAGYLGLALVEAQAAGLPCATVTQVPREAIVAEEFVRQIALDQSDADWADAVRTMRDRRMPAAGEANARCATSACAVDRCNERIHAISATARAA